MEYILSVLQTYSDAFKYNLVKRALTVIGYLHSIDYRTSQLSKIYAIDILIDYLDTKEEIDQSALDEFFIVLSKCVDNYLLCLGIIIHSNTVLSKKIELLEFIYAMFTLDQNLATHVLQVLETDSNRLQQFSSMMMEYTEWTEIDVIETIQELDSEIMYALEEVYKNTEAKISRQQDEYDTNRIF